MWDKNMTMNEAIEDAIQDLGRCCQNFDQAADSLRQKALDYGESVQRDIEELIECFETTQTGCYNWSKKTDRYSVSSNYQKDGSLVVDF
jgi:hypothetical protein